MRSIVVIPTYNERSTISELVQKLLEIPSVDILIVDDNSPDGTGVLVQELSRQNRRVYVLRRDAKRGLGSAYREGFRWALEHGYERVIQMDGDGSHDPGYVTALIEHSRQYDVVIGSRYIPGGHLDASWSFRRRIMSSLGNWYTNLLLRSAEKRYAVRDSTGGFKCWRAELLSAINLTTVRSDGYAFQTEMNWRAVQHGARILEIPITFYDRKGGKSKLARSGILSSLLLPLKLFLKKEEPAGRP